MTKEYIISSGLLELYALGQTTEDETAQVLHAFINWPDVKKDVLSMQKNLEAYATIDAVQASKNVRNQLFKSLKMEEVAAKADAAEREYNNFNLVKYTAAAAILLLFASLTFNVIQFGKNATSEYYLSEAKQQINAFKDSTSQTLSAMKVVQSKYSLPLKLKPDIAPKDADAKIYWLTNTGEIYLDPTNLPTAPEGKQYQLWAIVDGKAIDAGLIVPNKDKTLRFQQMKTFGKAEAFAVTLEVTGGVVASKEKPYVIVSL